MASRSQPSHKLQTGPALTLTACAHQLTHLGRRRPLRDPVLHLAERDTRCGDGCMPPGCALELLY